MGGPSATFGAAKWLSSTPPRSRSRSTTPTTASFSTRAEPCVQRYLWKRHIGTRAFPFGGAFRADFARRTHALCRYLGWVDPRLQWFASPEAWPYAYFGVHDEARGSFVLARDGCRESFGSDAAERALVKHLHDWVDHGLPSAKTTPVRTYRFGCAPSLTPGQVHVLDGCLTQPQLVLLRPGTSRKRQA